MDVIEQNRHWQIHLIFGENVSIFGTIHWPPQKSKVENADESDNDSQQIHAFQL